MNAGWSNLIPQEKKYTPQLAAKAASLLESGTTLTATARLLHISRSSLRNWAGTDPRLGRAFETFDQRKQEAVQNPVCRLKASRSRTHRRLAAEEQRDPVREAYSGGGPAIGRRTSRPPKQGQNKKR